MGSRNLTISRPQDRLKLLIVALTHPASIEPPGCSLDITCESKPNRLVFLFVFIVFSFGMSSRALGTAAGGFFMPFLAHIAFSPGWRILAALTGIGLLVGLILSYR